MYVKHNECRKGILPKTMNAIKMTTATGTAMTIVVVLLFCSAGLAVTGRSVVAGAAVDFVVCFASCDI